MDKKMGIGIGIILLNNNNEVLLLLRNSDATLADSDMHYEGEYTLPAGKVKFGEDLEDAAVRKVKAETNLDVENKDVDIICILNDYNEYAHYLTIGAIARKFSGSIDLGSSKEHVKYIWKSLDNLPQNICKSSREIIRLYRGAKWYERNQD